MWDWQQGYQSAEEILDHNYGLANGQPHLGVQKQSLIAMMAWQHGQPYVRDRKHSADSVASMKEQLSPNTNLQTY